MHPKMFGNPIKINLWTLLLAVFLLSACASPYLKGVTPRGDRAYLGPVPIEKTESYQTYLHSRHTEVDKQRYLFQRLKASENLQFYDDGRWYDTLEAYRGGMWLMRNRYKEGQDSREFIRKYIERSEQTNQYRLVQYPDGSVQIGSYILYNELDLLEETTKKDLADKA